MSATHRHHTYIPSFWHHPHCISQRQHVWVAPHQQIHQLSGLPTRSSLCVTEPAVLNTNNGAWETTAEISQLGAESASTKLGHPNHRGHVPASDPSSCLCSLWILNTWSQELLFLPLPKEVAYRLSTSMTAYPLIFPGLTGFLSVKANIPKESHPFLSTMAASPSLPSFTFCILYYKTSSVYSHINILVTYQPIPTTEILL